MKRVYFDNAASTPILPEVQEVMADCLQHCYGNPSSIHHEGRQARALIEGARKTIAQSLNAGIGEIFFTSGGTESNNMAIKCAVRDFGIRRIITTPVEHHCVLHTVECLERAGMPVEYLAVDHLGLVAPETLDKALQAAEGPVLVSIMHANNETGSVHNLAEMAEICTRHGALLHSDTVQTYAHFPIDVSSMNIAFLSGAAHKFHGPKGTGFIYINSNNLIKPFIDGGAQERNMRAGTENIAGIAGMAKAVELALKNMDAHREYISSLKNYLREQLILRFEGVAFNGDVSDNSLYTVLNVRFPRTPMTELMVMTLDVSGIAASGGSACSSGAEQGSHVLHAMQVPADTRSVRFSFSHLNTRREVDFLLDRLAELLPAAQKTSLMYEQ